MVLLLLQDIDRVSGEGVVRGLAIGHTIRCGPALQESIRCSEVGCSIGWRGRVRGGRHLEQGRQQEVQRRQARAVERLGLSRSSGLASCAVLLWRLEAD